MCLPFDPHKISGVIDSVFYQQPTSSPPLSLTTLETFLQQETKVAELLFSNGNKRIKAALTLGESTMFTVPFRVMSQSLTI